MPVLGWKQLIAHSIYLEIKRPKRGECYPKLMGPYRVSGRQTFAIYPLYEQVLPSCSLRSESLPKPSMGIYIATSLLTEGE